MTITSRQLALQYADIRTLYKLTDDNAIEDFAALKEDVVNLIGLMNNNSKPLFGVGSPEGVTAANNSLIYFDNTLAPVSLTMYANQTVGEKTGWVPII